MTTLKFNHIYIYSVRSLFHNHETITHTGFLLTENPPESKEQALQMIGERLQLDNLFLPHNDDLKDQAYIIKEYTEEILSRIKIDDFTGLSIASYWFDTETTNDNCIVTFGVCDSKNTCTQEDLWLRSLQWVGELLPDIYHEERSEETFNYHEATQYTKDAILRMLMEKTYEPA